MSNTASVYDVPQDSVHDMTERDFTALISIFAVGYIAIAAVIAAWVSTWTWPTVLVRGWDISGLLQLGFMLACLMVSFAGIGIAAPERKRVPVKEWSEQYREGLRSIATGGRRVTPPPLYRVEAAPVELVAAGGVIIAAAMGALTGPYIARLSTGTVIQAFIMAALVVVGTGMVGWMLPQNLSAWGGPILGGLLAGIGFTLFGPMLGIPVALIDWAVVFLFAGIMIYDLNQAKRMDRNISNALVVATSVFLNFANIFIRLAAILGNDD